jgi:putative ABC transport system permease protein
MRTDATPMDALIRDVKQAFRLLSGNRGFAAAALITIAVGVGGTAAVFSVVYGVLLRPLPYPEPEQLVRLWEVHPGANAPLSDALLSEPTFSAWSRTRGSLQGIAAFRVSDYTVSGFGVTERLRGTKVTPQLFRVLRLPPAAGRFFIDADAQPGAPPVVVLAYATWREQFGGDPSAVGKALAIDNVDHQIIGVAPAGLSFPGRAAGWSDSPRDIKLYTPLAATEMKPRGNAIGITEAIARLRPGASIAQAEREGTALARSVHRPSADLVFGNGGRVEVRVRPIVDQMTTGVQPALLVFAAAVGLVLLIACANVANLFLSRGIDRARELAVRAALGASRGTLARQLLTESLVISLIGGAGGVFVGWALTAAVPALAPPGFPRLEDIRVDLWFLGAAVLAAVLIGVVSGVLPAARSSRIDPDVTLRADGTRSVGTSGGRVRRMLLVAEAALAVVLLIGATSLARSFVSLVNLDAGYDPTNVLTADLYVMGAGDTANPRRTSQLAVSIIEHLRATPGVRAAGAGNMVPLGGLLWSSGFALPGMTTPDGRPVVARALQAVVTPGYAEALGLRLKEGRFFRPEDTTSSIQPLLVNEAFARTYFTDGKPITGRRFVGMFPRMLGRDDAIFDVVGVVEHVLPVPAAQPQPQVYVAHGGGFDMGSAALVVKTEGNPAPVAAALRAIVRQLDSGATLDRMGPLADKISSSFGESRFAAFVLITFSVLAVVLATTGLYGVLSYDVTQRRREIGVRAALGATPNQLVGMVLREGLAVTGIGLIVGIVAAAVATRAVASVLYGISSLDGVAFSVGPLLLLVVACVTCLIPARRAASIDPTQALKAE